MRVALISTYELGHQPFGLASAAAWAREAGASVTCSDLSIDRMDYSRVIDADLVAFYVPMHTATRLAIRVASQVRSENPKAALCFFGLYAPACESALRAVGPCTILGGEFEEGFRNLVERLATTSWPVALPDPEPIVSLARQRFVVPDRASLPPLTRYAFLTDANGERKTVGYTEATRGCKHLCRHCPIVPVYEGRFRVVQREVVLQDIDNQVAAGAQHITFGDPDFFNGPAHSLAIVREMHRAHEDLTYDVTIKVEHLLHHAHLLSELRETGCILVTTAVESFDDEILAILDKGHTAGDISRTVLLLRNVGIGLNPTFVSFTPWTTASGYLKFVRAVSDLNLVRNVSPIQYAIRLLIPNNSKLLELDSVRSLLAGVELDNVELCYRWTFADAVMEDLYRNVSGLVSAASTLSRAQIYGRILGLALEAAAASPSPSDALEYDDWPVPYLSEPWYC